MTFNHLPKMLLFAIILGIHAATAYAKCSVVQELRSATPQPRRIIRPNLDDFRRNFSKFEEITTEDNRASIAAMHITSKQKSICAYIGAANQKDLNDFIIGDKSLVDNIQNYSNSLTYGAIKKDAALTTLLEGRPYLRYRDYNAVEFRFAGGDELYTNEVKKRLAQDYQQTAIEFEKKIEALPIRHSYHELDGISAMPRTWHRAGTGETPAQARAAAKWAEHLNQNLPHDAVPHMVDFSEAEPHYRGFLVNIKDIGKRLAHNDELKKVGFLVAPEPEKRWILSEEAMDYFKKAKTPAEFSELVQSVFKVHLSETEIKDVTEYYQTAENFFSPKVYQDERVGLHGMDTPAGATWIDYAGLSSRKIFATLRGIEASPGHDVKAALENIEQFFAEDHARLLKQHEAINAIAKESYGNSILHASGDDVVVLTEQQLTDAQKRKFVRLISRNPETNRIRTVFTTLKDPKIRGPIIHDSEMLEKAARLELARKLDREVLRNLNFAMNLKQDASGAMKVEPLIAGPLSKSEKDIIRSVFNNLNHMSASIDSVVFLN